MEGGVAVEQGVRGAGVAACFRWWLR